MVIMSACKPDMHVHAEIGLYGTKKQMQSTEDVWITAGNTLKPRGFTAVFGVNLDIPEKDWVDTRLAESKANAIPVVNGWEFTLRDGSIVLAPEGYRPLNERELPSKEKDICYNFYAKVWEQIESSGLEANGPAHFKDRCHGVIRRRK
jgi:hypothetical protein